MKAGVSYRRVDGTYTAPLKLIYSPYEGDLFIDSDTGLIYNPKHKGKLNLCGCEEQCCSLKDSIYDLEVGDD